MQNVPADVVAGSTPAQILSVADRTAIVQAVIQYHKDDPAFVAVYQHNLDLINAANEFVPHISTYNFPLSIPINIQQIGDIFIKINGQQKNTYKIQMMFPGIFRYNGNLDFEKQIQDNDNNNDDITPDDIYKFGYGSNNSYLLLEPLLISNQQQFTNFLNDHVNQDNLLESVSMKRFSTKYSLDCITNVTVKLYPLESLLLIGCPDIDCSVIQYDRNIYPLIYSPRLKRNFNDRLCFFRALALAEVLSLTAIKTYIPSRHLPNVEKRVAEMLLLAYPGWSLTPRLFDGVPFHDMERLQGLFQVTICLYRYAAAHRAVTIVHNGLLNRTNSTFPVRHLHLEGGHVALIRNVDLYAKRFMCDKCTQILSQQRHLLRHQERHCTVAQKQRFSDGAFVNRPNALLQFEKLFNHKLPSALRFQTTFAVFDFESILQTAGAELAQRNTATLTIKQRHLPVSYAIASNIVAQPLIFRFIDCQKDIPQLIVSFLADLDQLQHLYQRQQEQRYAAPLQILQLAISQTISPFNKPYIKLLEKFQQHIFTLNVIGFNSSGYDIKLIREYLFPLSSRRKLAVIKQHSRYTALFCDTLRFLDLCSYLAPHTSLKEFLCAFTTESKGFFPYTWFDSFDKLQKKELPSLVDFDDIFKKTQLCPSEYQHCLDIWCQNNMQSFSDYLQYYNQLDCTATIAGIAKMMTFYQTLNVCLFTDGISLPGLCSHILFDPLQDQTFFGCISPAQKQVFVALRAAVTGGLSCTFTRYHEKNKTLLSHGSNICRTVEGWDCNSLYLWALGQQMPTGHLILRQRHRAFRPEGKPVRKAVLWLEYLAKTRHNGRIVRHQFNYGEQLIAGRYRVDGFYQDASWTVAYDFHGCYFHICPFCPPDGKRCATARPSALEEARATVIRQFVDEYVVMHECQFDLAVHHDLQLKAFLDNYKIRNVSQNALSQEQILQQVINNEIFGILEVDIHVPPQLQHKFQEFPPIILNATLTKDDLSPHMRQHLDQYCQGMFSPRRSLISVLEGRRQYLITPLIQFYLNHGLIITNVYSVMQWQPQLCFQKFCDTVIENRSRADYDATQSIVGEMFKLIGNSAYGRTLMQTERFQNIKFTSAQKVDKYYRQNLFRDCSQINSQCYKITMARKTVNCFQPIQIGFFVYGWAKLRMLEFYYDFLNYYIPRPRFEILLTDTDSLYVAFSDLQWKDRISRPLYPQFLQERDRWLVSDKTADNYKNLRRQRGLFKLEFLGSGLIALGSKLYVAFDEGEINLKKACKGIQRRNNLRVDAYRHVLATHASIPGHNYSFLFQNNQMITVETIKTAISYLYVKRYVAADGIHTSPLAIY